MADYIVEERNTGIVVYAYTADEATDFPEYPYAQYNHILKKPDPVVIEQRTITRLEYLRRFTTEERVTIRAVSAQNAVLADYLQLMEMAQDISLDDPDTIAAVNMLEQAGLLASGRAAEVLS